MALIKTFRKVSHKVLPDRIYKSIRNIRMARFLREAKSLTFQEKIQFIEQIYNIHSVVDCPHKQEEVLQFIQAIHKLPDDMPGVVVEAGCYKGGSTAKFSLACASRNRTLYVFDSFEGIPPNAEKHGKNIFGVPTKFDEGSYIGELDEVQKNVAAHGEISCCNFIKGWFEDSMREFNEPVCAAYLDCDLQSSTKTCLKYLYPLLQPGGVLYSQDGHLPLVIQAFDDDEFWEQEVGASKPVIYGLGTSKIIRIVKPDS